MLGSLEMRCVSYTALLRVRPCHPSRISAAATGVRTSSAIWPTPHLSAAVDADAAAAARAAKVHGFRPISVEEVSRQHDRRRLDRPLRSLMTRVPKSIIKSAETNGDMNRLENSAQARG